MHTFFNLLFAIHMEVYYNQRMMKSFVSRLGRAQPKGYFVMWNLGPIRTIRNDLSDSLDGFKNWD